MNPNQELPLPGHPDGDETLFADEKIRVRNRDGERITEDRTRVSEFDAVFSLIRQLLLRVLLKRDSSHPYLSLTNGQRGCEPASTRT
jgi:hypothetical protein